MILPTWKPIAHDQIFDRRHSDPPVLWLSVILGSVVIHLVAFWMLRLLLTGRLPSLLSDQAFISVDLITVAPTTSPAQAIQPPTSTVTRTPTSQGAPIPSGSNRRTNPSSSSVTSSPRINSQPTPTPQRQVGATSNSSQNQQPISPTGQNPPNSSQNQPAVNPTGQNSPDSSQNQPAVNPTGPNSPDSSQNQPPNTPSEQNAPDTQSGSGFFVSVSNSDVRRSVPGADIPSQEARPKIGQKRFAASDYELQLGGNLDQDIVLEVLLLIDRNGNATLQKSPQVVQGNTSVDPTKLTQLILQDLQFEPAYMDGGAVDQEYFVRFHISPVAN